MLSSTLFQKLRGASMGADVASAPRGGRSQSRRFQTSTAGRGAGRYTVVKQDNRQNTTGYMISIAIAALVQCIVVSSLLGQEPSQADDPKDKDKQVGERLIRDAGLEGDLDVMDKAIRLMDTASRKLEVDFDAGAKTQELQRRAMDRLQEAIKIAAAQRRPVRSRRQRPSGDKRKRAKGKPQKSSMTKSGTKDSGGTAKNTVAPGSATKEGGKTGDLRETRRAWGNLPLREREELMQGADEQFLERYRDWIERYYRALQETDE